MKLYVYHFMKRHGLYMKKKRKEKKKISQSFSRKFRFSFLLICFIIVLFICCQVLDSNRSLFCF